MSQNKERKGATRNQIRASEDPITPLSDEKCVKDPTLPCPKHETVIIQLTRIEEDLKHRGITNGELKNADSEMWKALASFKHQLGEFDKRLPSPFISKVQQALVIFTMTAIIGFMITFTLNNVFKVIK